MSISSDDKSAECSNCGCLETTIDDNRGEVTCNDCGLVLDDNRLDTSTNWSSPEPAYTSPSPAFTGQQSRFKSKDSLPYRQEILNKRALSSNNSQPGESKWKEIRDHICQFYDLDIEINKGLLRRCREMHMALEKQMFQSRRKPSKRTRTGRKKRIDNSIRGGRHPVMKSVVRAVILIEEDRLDSTPIASKKHNYTPRRWEFTGIILNPLVEKVSSYLEGEGHFLPEPEDIRNYFTIVLKALNAILKPVQHHSKSTKTIPSEDVEIYQKKVRQDSKDAFDDDIMFILNELGHGGRSQPNDVGESVLKKREAIFEAMTRYDDGESYPIRSANMRRKCHCEVIYRVLKYHQVETTRKGVGEILSKLAKQPPHGSTVATKWRKIAEYVIKEVY